MSDKGQKWLLSWESPASILEGTNHGATAICFAEAGVVLVSPDQGESWGFPGGRPESCETIRQTLDREVLEEACARVVDAKLLGFSRGECISGPEKGLVLVRALYAAEVKLNRFIENDETSLRKTVPLEDVMSQVTYQQGAGPLFERWIHEASNGST